MGYAVRDEHYHTYADYRSWPDDIRYELIGGCTYLMTPAPSLDHQTIAFEVGRQLGNALDGKPCRVLLVPVDVLLNAAQDNDDTADTVVQPDVLVVCDAAKLTPRAVRAVRGAPDWVLEVISPSSASHDQIIKLAAYEKAGVREYWLSHPADRVLTIYRHDGQSYGRPTLSALTGETPVGVLPGVSIHWETTTGDDRLYSTAASIYDGLTPIFQKEKDT